VSVNSSASTKGTINCLEKSLSRHVWSAWNISSSHNLSNFVDGETTAPPHLSSQNLGQNIQSVDRNSPRVPSFLFARQQGTQVSSWSCPSAMEHIPDSDDMRHLVWQSRECWDRGF
jgi:hypothetical protein